MPWRDPQRAGVLMWAYFLISLAVGPVFYVTADGGPAELKGHLPGVAVSAFLAWRVTRGGRISRTLLVIGTELGFLVTASGIASRFGPLVFGSLAAYAAQAALLLSPAVYRRTRPRGWRARAGRDRFGPPPGLLLPGVLVGLLAGLVVTVLALGHMNYMSAPDFQAAPPAGCDYGDAARLPASACLTTLAEGGPLYWLASFHGAPVTDWAAMVRDWTQWAVISTAVLYLGWLIVARDREAPARTRGTAASAAAASVLAGLAVTVLTGGVPLTWLTANQDVPVSSKSAFLADTALWSLAALVASAGVLLPVLAARRARGQSPVDG